MKNLNVCFSCSGTLLWLEQPCIPWLAERAQSLDTSLIFSARSTLTAHALMCHCSITCSQGSRWTSREEMIILPLFPGSLHRLVGKAAPCTLPFLQGFSVSIFHSAKIKTSCKWWRGRIRLVGSSKQPFLWRADEVAFKKDYDRNIFTSVKLTQPVSIFPLIRWFLLVLCQV